MTQVCDTCGTELELAPGIDYYCPNEDCDTSSIEDHREAIDLIRQSMQDRDYEDIDPEEYTKSDEDGWVRLYLECPDCESPMVHSYTESESIEDGSSTEIHALCTECQEVESTLSIERTTEHL